MKLSLLTVFVAAAFFCLAQDAGAEQSFSLTLTNEPPPLFLFNIGLDESGGEGSQFVVADNDEPSSSTERQNYVLTYHSQYWPQKYLEWHSGRIPSTLSHGPGIGALTSGGLWALKSALRVRCSHWTTLCAISSTKTTDPHRSMMA